MSEPLTYVMLKPRKVGKSVRQPGELVPEAEKWASRNAYISRGVIAPVPVAGLSEKHKTAYQTWKADQERRSGSRSPQPEPESSGPQSPGPQSPGPQSPATPSEDSGSGPSEDSGSGMADQIDSMTIADIRQKVESGEWDPAEVWEVESEGKQRSTLMNWLEEQVEDEG